MTSALRATLAALTLIAVSACGNGGSPATGTSPAPATPSATALPVVDHDICAKVEFAVDDAYGGRQAETDSRGS